MRKKQLTFEFTNEDIQFVKRILKTGEIKPDDVKVMAQIFKERIDPSYNVPCDGCQGIIKENFRRLESIMCESLGVKDIRSYVVKPFVDQYIERKIDKLTKEGDELFEKTSPLNKKGDGFLSRLSKAIKETGE